MASLARWCFAHRRIVLAIWIVAAIATSTVGLLAGSRYTAEFPLPPSDSRSAQKILDKDFPQQAAQQNTLVIETFDGAKVTDATVKDRVEATLTKMKDLPSVEFVDSPYTVGNEEQIDPTHTIAYANLQVKVPKSGTPVADVKKIMDVGREMQTRELSVYYSGQAIKDALEPVPGVLESVGMVAAGVVLFVAFGSLVTMSLPLLAALASLAIAIPLVGLLTHAFALASFSPQLAALMALGVGIDYALFVVNRHQNFMAGGKSSAESVELALSTTGRSVVFAGLVVCAGLVGLVALRISFLGGLAIAAAAAVVATMLASITLLPAMLGFVGDKALPKKRRGAGPVDEIDEAKQSKWYGWAKRIQRKPVAWGLLAVVVMGALAVPSLSLRLGAADDSNDPGSSTTRKSYDLLVKGFGPGQNSPLLLVTKFKQPEDFNTFTNFLDTVSAAPGIRSVAQPMTSPNGRSAVAFVYPTTGPQDEATSKLITHLRKDVIPQAKEGKFDAVHVGGVTASFDDFASVVQDKLWIFVAVVLVLSFFLLMFIFRSLVVPLKACVLNALACASAFGVIVAVFQWGWGGELIGGGSGPIESFVPVILFAVLFGLSMDYEVFMVSRIREEWQRTGDNGEAVAIGQAATAKLITAAALIMVSIFSSFVFGPDRIIKMFGIGLGVAVLLDALIVRTVLVPATMHIAGQWNWWLPDWLDQRMTSYSLRGGRHFHRTSSKSSHNPRRGGSVAKPRRKRK